MNEDQKRPQFGARVVEKDSDIFKHNAWDRVEWDEEQESAANRQIEEQISKRFFKKQKL